MAGYFDQVTAYFDNYMDDVNASYSSEASSWDDLLNASSLDLDVDSTTIISLDEYAYSTNDKVWLVIIQIVSLLGLLGSMVVLVETSADQWKGKGTTVTRVLMGEMIGSVAHSLGAFLGTWPMPVGMPQWGASGTTATCSAVGLMMSWGALVTGLWDMVLSLTYVLMVCYSWKPERLLKLEKGAHAFIWIFGTGWAISGLFLGIYGVGMVRCWASNYSCDVETGTCEAHHNLWFFNGVSWLSYFVAVILSVWSLIKLYRQVRRLEEKNQKYSFAANVAAQEELEAAEENEMNDSQHSNRSKLSNLSGAISNLSSNISLTLSNPFARPTPEQRKAYRKSRAVAIQGMLYAGTVFIVSCPIIVFNCVYFSTGWYNATVSYMTLLCMSLHGILYVYLFLRRRKQTQTALGRFTKKLLFDYCARCCCLCRACCDENNPLQQSVRATMGGRRPTTLVTTASTANQSLNASERTTSRFSFFYRSNNTLATSTAGQSVAASGRFPRFSSFYRSNNTLATTSTVGAKQSVTASQRLPRFSSFYVYRSNKQSLTASTAVPSQAPAPCTVVQEDQAPETETSTAMPPNQTQPNSTVTPHEAQSTSNAMPNQTQPNSTVVPVPAECEASP